MPSPSPLPEANARERLQPSLLDRLADEVKGLEREIARVRRVLLPELDVAAQDALAGLLAPERATLPRPGEFAPFTALGPKTEALVRQLLELEQRRQREIKTRFVLSPERLRACVLRDLAWLFNTDNLRRRAGGAEAPDGLDLEAHPQAATSVVNFGIPPLAGRTVVDPETVAEDLEGAIRRFEPRLRERSVSVRPVAEAQAGHVLAFDIEAELLAEPIPLRLLVRTLIDLESGAVTLGPGGSA